MKEYRTVFVDGIRHTVFISDDQEALWAAQADQRAVLGIWDPEHPEAAPWGIPFLAEKGAPVSADFLERIVRRKEGLPWIIARTGRLILREFRESDWEAAAEIQDEEDCPPAFADKETFQAYIRNQYPFYQYGIWAVTEKQTGTLMGAAGVWDMPDPPDGAAGHGGEAQPALELGYWIRREFRKRGYGREAVQAAVDYAGENIGENLYLRIRAGNEPSRRLAEALGFCCFSGGAEGEKEKEKDGRTVLLFHRASSSPSPNHSE